MTSNDVFFPLLNLRAFIKSILFLPFVKGKIEGLLTDDVIYISKKGIKSSKSFLFHSDNEKGAKLYLVISNYNDDKKRNLC